VRTDNSYACKIRVSIGGVVAVPLWTYLLHDTCFSLRECDVTARLVGDELDLDLASLATSLLIVVIIIVGSHGVSWSLDPSRIIAVEVVTRRWVIEASRRITDVSHCGMGTESTAGLG
jgi:hypothetical protein